MVREVNEMAAVLLVLVDQIFFVDYLSYVMVCCTTYNKYVIYELLGDWCTFVEWIITM